MNSNKKTLFVCVLLLLLINYTLISGTLALSPYTIHTTLDDGSKKILLLLSLKANGLIIPWLLTIFAVVVALWYFLG